MSKINIKRVFRAIITDMQGKLNQYAKPAQSPVSPLLLTKSAKACLYADTHNQITARTAFFKHILDKLQKDKGFPKTWTGDPKTRKKTPETATTTLEDLFGRTGKEKFLAALEEEANSKKFMRAVLDGADLFVPGEQGVVCKEIPVLAIAGPSGSGKTRGAKEAFKKAYQDSSKIKTDKKTAGLHGILVDGGVVRETSQLWHIAVLLAIVSGHTGVRDLYKNAGVLERAKARLLSTANANVGHTAMVYLDTFSSWFSIIPVLNWLQNIPGTLFSFFRVDGINPDEFRQSVEGLARQRAYGHPDDEHLDDDAEDNNHATETLPKHKRQSVRQPEKSDRKSTILASLGNILSFREDKPVETPNDLAEEEAWWRGLADKLKESKEPNPKAFGLGQKGSEFAQSYVNSDRVEIIENPVILLRQKGESLGSRLRRTQKNLPKPHPVWVRFEGSPKPEHKVLAVSRKLFKEWSEKAYLHVLYKAKPANEENKPDDVLVLRFNASHRGWELIENPDVVDDVNSNPSYIRVRRDLYEWEEFWPFIDDAKKYKGEPPYIPLKKYNEKYSTEPRIYNVQMHSLIVAMAQLENLPPIRDRIDPAAILLFNQNMARLRDQMQLLEQEQTDTKELKNTLIAMAALRLPPDYTNAILQVSAALDVVSQSLNMDKQRKARIQRQKLNNKMHIWARAEKKSVSFFDAHPNVKDILIGGLITVIFLGLMLGIIAACSGGVGFVPLLISVITFGGFIPSVPLMAVLTPLVALITFCSITTIVGNYVRQEDAESLQQEREKVLNSENQKERSIQEMSGIFSSEKSLVAGLLREQEPGHSSSDDETMMQENDLSKSGEVSASHSAENLAIPAETTLPPVSDTPVARKTVGNAASNRHIFFNKYKNQYNYDDFPAGKPVWGTSASMSASDTPVEMNIPGNAASNRHIFFNKYKNQYNYDDFLPGERVWNSAGK